MLWNIITYQTFTPKKEKLDVYAMYEQRMYTIHTTYSLYIWCVAGVSHTCNTSGIHGKTLRKHSTYILYITPMLGIHSTCHSFVFHTDIFFGISDPIYRNIWKNVKLHSSNLHRTYVRDMYNVSQRMCNAFLMFLSMYKTFFLDDMFNTVWEHITPYPYCI